MAKKPTKKPAKPSVKKAARKPAPKASKSKAAKPQASKSSASQLPPGARPAGTGKGPSPMDIGRELVALYNSGQASKFEKKYLAKNIVSCEGVGVGLEWVGLAAVQAKSAEWMKMHTVLGAAAEGPFVGSTGFAVKFLTHLKVNATGEESHMQEIGVYTVKDGQVVREEFMYAC